MRLSIVKGVRINWYYIYYYISRESLASFYEQRGTRISVIIYIWISIPGMVKE